MKVMNSDPLHDEKVKHLIESAMRHVVVRQIERGVGVIDFADCTVVTITPSLPLGTVHVMQRLTENSILHGGFGDKVF